MTEVNNHCPWLKLDSNLTGTWLELDLNLTGTWLELDLNLKLKKTFTYLLIYFLPLFGFLVQFFDPENIFLIFLTFFLSLCPIFPFLQPFLVFFLFLTCFYPFLPLFGFLVHFFLTIFFLIFFRIFCDFMTDFHIPSTLFTNFPFWTRFWPIFDPFGGKKGWGHPKIFFHFFSDFLWFCVKFWACHYFFW